MYLPSPFTDVRFLQRRKRTRVPLCTSLQSHLIYHSSLTSGSLRRHPHRQSIRHASKHPLLSFQCATSPTRLLQTAFTISAKAAQRAEIGWSDQLPPAPCFASTVPRTRSPALPLIAHANCAARYSTQIEQHHLWIDVSLAGEPPHPSPFPPYASPFSRVKDHASTDICTAVDSLGQPTSVCMQVTFAASISRSDICYEVYILSQ
jgi:hypothetical protein